MLGAEFAQHLVKQRQQLFNRGAPIRVPSRPIRYQGIPEAHEYGARRAEAEIAARLDMVRSAHLKWLARQASNEIERRAYRVLNALLTFRDAGLLNTGRPRGRRPMQRAKLTSEVIDAVREEWRPHRPSELRAASEKIWLDFHRRPTADREPWERDLHCIRMFLTGE